MRHCIGFCFSQDNTPAHGPIILANEIFGSDENQTFLYEQDTAHENPYHKLKHLVALHLQNNNHVVILSADPQSLPACLGGHTTNTPPLAWVTQKTTESTSQHLFEKIDIKNSICISTATEPAPHAPKITTYSLAESHQTSLQSAIKQISKSKSGWVFSVDLNAFSTIDQTINALDQITQTWDGTTSPSIIHIEGYHPELDPGKVLAKKIATSINIMQATQAAS